MAEGGNSNNENSATKKEWVVPIARGLDLKREKHWAIVALYDLFGWRTTKNKEGLYDIDEEVIGPTETASNEH